MDSSGSCLKTARIGFGAVFILLMLINMAAYKWTPTSVNVPSMIDTSVNSTANKLNIAIYRNQSAIIRNQLSLSPSPVRTIQVPLPLYAERIARLEKVCSSFKEARQLQNQSKTKEKPPQRFYVNKKKKVFYCQISKVACTTWTALVTDPNLGYQSLPGMGVHSKPRLRKANITQTSKYAKEYDSFTRFVVVRHPLDRVLSAYHNIVHRRSSLGPGPSIVKSILNLYHVGVNNLTLSQFVDFLINIDNRNIPGRVLYDRHWDTYAHACSLCSIKYDYVIYFEDMPSDSKPILKALGWPLDHLITKEKVNPSLNEPEKDQNNPWSVHLNEYKSINRDQLDRLLLRYEEDMKLFGYTFDPKTLRTGFMGNMMS